MKEYIDKKLLIDTYCEENCGNRKCVDAFDKCIFISHVLEQPVADVKEVIHAKWIWKDFNYDGFHILCCSECFGTEGARENANYCPECGARMDLD